jgi:CubicO group peptidase (beta-lactamase class C family)
MNLYKTSTKGIYTRFALCLISAGSLIACSNPKIIDDEIDQILNQEVVVKQNYPFLTVYVEDAQGELLVSSKVASEAFFEPAEAPTMNDWMRIWSMTKLVTTVLTLDLIEDGLINLEDEVTKYLPELGNLMVARPLAGGTFPERSATSYELGNNEGKTPITCDYTLERPERAMTVRDLMLHTAGFYYATTNLPCLDEPLSALALPLTRTSEEWLSGLATLPLIQSPSDNYYYGQSTTVLGFLLERASGLSLQALLEDRITKPYQITGLSFLLPDDVSLPPRVSGVDGTLRLAREGELDIFGGEQPPYGTDTTLFLGGEGMIATAQGFAKFLGIVFFPHERQVRPLLDPPSIAAMTSPQINFDTGWGATGYTLWLSNGRRGDNTYGRARIWTGGGYEGTRYWIDPELKQIGVIMTQVFMSPATGLSVGDKIRDILESPER